VGDVAGSGFASEMRGGQLSAHLESKREKERPLEKAFAYEKKRIALPPSRLQVDYGSEERRRGVPSDCRELYRFHEGGRTPGKKKGQAWGKRKIRTS